MRNVPALPIIASLALSLLAACSTPASLPALAAPSAHPLPAWDGAMARVFDDTIDREALDHGTVSQSEDAWIGPRTQAADHVVRVRVITTTTQGGGPVAGLPSHAARGRPSACGERSAGRGFRDLDSSREPSVCRGAHARRTHDGQDVRSVLQAVSGQGRARRALVSDRGSAADSRSRAARGNAVRGRVPASHAGHVGDPGIGKGESGPGALGKPTARAAGAGCEKSWTEQRPVVLVNGPERGQSDTSPPDSASCANSSWKRSSPRAMSMRGVRESLSSNGCNRPFVPSTTRSTSKGSAVVTHAGVSCNAHLA